MATDRDYYEKGKEYFEVKDFVEAEFCFKLAVKGNPKNWSAWFGRGLCLKRLENYEQAIFCFEKVLNYNPDFKQALYNLGYCYAQLNSIENALFYLNRCLRIDPENYLALGIKAWIYMNKKDYKNTTKLLELIQDIRPNLDKHLDTPEFIKSLPDNKLLVELFKDMNEKVRKPVSSR